MVPSGRRGKYLPSEAHQLGERRAFLQGLVVATWYGDDSPHLSLPNSQLLSAAVTVKIQETERHAHPGLDERLPGVVRLPRSWRACARSGVETRRNLAAASPSTGSPAGRTPLNGDGSMCSQAYVRAMCKVCALPSSSVAARDRGHLKGAAGSGVDPSEELRQWRKCSDGWKGGRPEVRLDVGTMRSKSPKTTSDNLFRVLLQSGLYEKWWADSVECCCYLRNVQDLLADGNHSKAWSFRSEQWLSIV